MFTGLALCLGVIASGGDWHEQHNPLYCELRTVGIALEGQASAALLAPTLPDGLDAAAQQAALKGIPTRMPLGEFVRNSIVGPYAMSIEDSTSGPAGTRLRTVAVWFVAYGDLKTIRDNRPWFEEFLRNVEGKVHVLTAEELQQRGIRIPAELADRAQYSRTASTLLERVRLELTSYTVSSQNEDSMVLAGRVDPRFTQDKQMPNRWQPIDISGSTKVVGPAEPYGLSAFYWKVTPLREPAGALLIEYRSVFEQPKGWFGGHDLLRSKLPIAVQNEVRSFRRKLKKATEASG